MLWGPPTVRGKGKISSKGNEGTTSKAHGDPGTVGVLKAREENAPTVAIFPSKLRSGCHHLQKILPDPFCTLGFIWEPHLPGTPITPVGYTTLCRGCQLACLFR